MAEDRLETNEIDFRRWLPWTQIFRSFQVALDPRKLLLAALGILVMAIGWWLLANIFYKARTKPVWPTQYPSADYAKGATDEDPPEQRAWKAFKRERNNWNLLYEAAGPGGERTDAGDLASSIQEFDRIQAALDEGTIEKRDGKEFIKIKVPGKEGKQEEKDLEIKEKPYGRLRTWPWFEDRGPNPFLLISGKAGQPEAVGAAAYFPWPKGGFLDWFLRDQIPVLIEPLVKFLRPVVYLLHPNAGGWEYIYFLLVTAWTLGTWALFGGAITRMAAVQVARNEKIGWGEAWRFTLARWRSYLFASFAFLLFIAFFVVLLALFGVVSLIPGVAELWDGLLWPIVLVLGLLMALLLVGLVGWPLIHATLSTEGSDSFDALSRSLSYVYQRPWSYLWCCVVALVYGAAVVFFVGLMGSLTIYLGKWGVSHTPFADRLGRDPSYLFVYAPTSFGWRDLLLQGSPVGGGSTAVTEQAIQTYIDTSFKWWNYIGASLIWFWLTLFFMMVVGFGYSYFWSASTIIYLLMRRKVDDTELDEIYLEDEETEDAYSAPAPPPAPAPSGKEVQMVEAPSLVRSAATPVTAAPVSPSSEPLSGQPAAPPAPDGQSASGDGANP
jgi:hypothetical protein